MRRATPSRSPTDLRTAYDTLAPFYDCLWSGFEELVLPLLKRELFPHLSIGDAVLDLGCGTGLLARELTSRGFLVTAVDQSKGMLREAAKNAPKARLLLSSISAIPYSRQYSAALCTYDTLNHLLTFRSLVQALTAINRSLLPRSPFLFDVNSDLGFRSRWTGQTARTCASYVFTLVPRYSPRRHLASFRIIASSHVRQKLTTQVMILERCYSRVQLFTALRQAGFSEARLCVHPQGAARGGLGRLYFFARSGEHEFLSDATGSARIQVYRVGTRPSSQRL